MSPYSWTYPGGVTRHIEALASEVAAAGHEPTILAPFDPDDALSRRLHRGARPQQRSEPERFVSLGRTVGIPANGAVSNMALTPFAVQQLRSQLRHGGYDVAHLHEPVVPVAGWDALLSAGRLPLVGTFHTYSENLITNGTAAVLLGGRRRMNRLHVRIAVSEAAAWTARRFYGGRYWIVPNGVHLPAAGGTADGTGAEPDALASGSEPEPLRLLFVGQAVERKGLPVLLRAFEALREHVPATLTLVGAGPDEVAHMMLDDRGVHALGKVSEERKLAELARAEVLCAPSLHGESFGMVLTEAFAAATPVVASDIPGYRDVVRDGQDGMLVAPADALALAEALRVLALDWRLRERMARAARERAERFAWPRVAAEVLDCYDAARMIGSPVTRIGRVAVRHGLAPSDLLPRVPAERLKSLEAQSDAEPLARDSRRRRALRRLGLAASTLAAGMLGGLALQRVGIANVAASLVASKPGLLLAGLGLMCAAVFARAIAWHAILSTASTWKPVRRRDAMQGTFIGVLMSATLPARTGEPARAVVLARRLGRARESLPLVWATIASQTLLNLFALAVLGAVTVSTVHFEGHAARTLLFVGLIPVAAVLLTLLGPILLGPAAASRAERMRDALAAIRPSLARLRDGLHAFGSVRESSAATALQLVAWALQWVSCWLLLVALGLDAQAGAGAAAAVLFAVNITAAVPVTPANVGVFQAACAVVLIGAYHVSAPEAIAYGIVLQAVELASALIMGLPALVTEGLSWREVRLRTAHGAPVTLAPLPGAARTVSELQS
ncbi:MAG TPA: lysylphosphatidylglycerol synthase domain-containing protein [Solirubrobacteraceae bacterium]|nr:lysylphosphatidylglycerol synthase domain-containing protein [Solirubrobacteraceae bacterium]